MATPSYFLPVRNATLNIEPGLFFPKIIQNIRDVNLYALYGQEKNTGNLEFSFFPSAVQILKAAIGTDTVTSSAHTGLYVHTLNEANTLDSLTVEKAVGGFESEQFPGCRVNKLSIKCGATNEEVVCTADVMGKQPTVLTTPSSPFWQWDTPFVFGEAAVTLFGQSSSDVTDLTLDIENGLKENWVLGGTHDPTYITPTTLKVSGTLKVVFKSLDDANVGWLSKSLPPGTQGNLVVSFTHPAYQGLTITLPQVNWSKYADDLKIDDLVILSLSYEASYSVSSGYTVQVAVTNSQATAY